jgi:hypothetical protein
MDEQYYTIHGADGALKNAWLRGKMSMSKEGEVLYRFRASAIERK